MLCSRVLLVCVLLGGSASSAGVATAQAHLAIVPLLPASPPVPETNHPDVAAAPSLPPEPVPTPSVPADGDHRHRGFYLNASLGLGDLSVRFAGAGIWGRAYPLAISAGFALTKDLVLFGEFFDAHLFNPASSHTALTAFDLRGLGPGVKYYLTPANVFLSGSLLFSRLNYYDDVADYDIPSAGINVTSDWGLTGQLSLGKEWQVSPSWSLGIAGDVVLGRMKGEVAWANGVVSPGNTYTLKGFSLLASAGFSYPPSGKPDSALSASEPALSHHAFYFDARLGVGWLWGRFLDTLRYGPGLPSGLSAGWAPTRALVVFGEFFDVHMFSPNGSSENLDSADLYGFGPGLKCYVAPTKFFVSGSLSLSWFRYHSDGYSSSQRSHQGFTGHLSMGKEWWWSPHWGLGLAGDLTVGRMWPQTSEAYTPTAGSLLVSISYNLAPSDESAGAPGSSSRPAEGHAQHSLYLDGRVGLGALWVSAGNYLIRGMSFPFGLSAGFALTRDLVILGDFHNVVMFHPNSTHDHFAALDLYGVGPGVKYYLTPKGFFLSGSVLLSRLQYHGASFDDPGPRTEFSETSQWGGTARFSAGQEWSVSPSWSLGVGGELLVGRMGKGSFLYFEDGPYTPKGFSLLVSSSFHYPAERTTDGSEITSTPSIPAPGYHTHDGLYLNASLGVGWLRVKNTSYTSGFSGRGWPSALSIGVAFANRLVAFAEFYEMQIRNPSGDSDLVDLEWQGFGPGLKYYLMSANIFFSNSLLVSQLSMHDSKPGDSIYGINRISQWGITDRLSVGKEWWVSGDWGLGIAGELVLGRMAGTGSWGTYTVDGLSLLASASFN